MPPKFTKTQTSMSGSWNPGKSSFQGARAPSKFSMFSNDDVDEEPVKAAPKRETKIEEPKEDKSSIINTISDLQNSMATLKILVGSVGEINGQVAAENMSALRAITKANEAIVKKLSDSNEETIKNLSELIIDKRIEEIVNEADEGLKGKKVLIIAEEDVDLDNPEGGYYICRSARSLLKGEIKESHRQIRLVEISIDGI